MYWKGGNASTRIRLQWNSTSHHHLAQATNQSSPWPTPVLAFVGLKCWKGISHQNSLGLPNVCWISFPDTCPQQLCVRGSIYWGLRQANYVNVTIPPEKIRVWWVSIGIPLVINSHHEASRCWGDEMDLLSPHLFWYPLLWSSWQTSAWIHWVCIIWPPLQLHGVQHCTSFLGLLLSWMQFCLGDSWCFHIHQWINSHFFLLGNLWSSSFSEIKSMWSAVHSSFTELLLCRPGLIHL